MGRVLGGVSTSILFSCFDVWLASEHAHRKLPAAWLGQTFAIMTTGNGFVAISSGLVADALAERFGSVAPFQAATVCLVLTFILIAGTWRENYGTTSDSVLSSMKKALYLLKDDHRILYIGVIQACFEGAMFIFVFSWTLALEEFSEGPIPHGRIFSCFMVCMVIGSNVFSLLSSRGFDTIHILAGMVFVALCSLLTPAFLPSPILRFLAFCVFESCVGVFWPCIFTLRSTYIPEGLRTTVISMFRVPLNAFVIVTLLKVGFISMWVSCKNKCWAVLVLLFPCL